MKPAPESMSHLAVNALEIAQRLPVISRTCDPSIVLSLVIPTYNESQNIELLIRHTDAVLARCLGRHFEILVVDDDSPDGTWKIAASLMPSYPCLKVFRRKNEKCLATAVVDGWKESHGMILGVMDADLQHPPEVLEKLLQAMETGQNDLVVASRHAPKGGVSDWSFFRRIISRSAQLLVLILLPKIASRVRDPLSGYFLIRRSVIAECPLSPLGYKILLEVLYRVPVKQVREVGYVFHEREKGCSKADLFVYWQYLCHLFRMRFSKRGSV